jgi:hypothetical protein
MNLARNGRAAHGELVLKAYIVLADPETGQTPRVKTLGPDDSS